MNLIRGGWLIPLSLIFAFLLTLVRAPLAWPDWVAWLRPGWIVLVVSFWAMHFPHRMELFGAWIVGFFADVAFAHPIGLNGLVLVVVVYVIWRGYPRLAMYSIPQQALAVSALVLFSEVVRCLAHDPAHIWTLVPLLPAATSLVLWPFLQRVLIKLARRYGVE